MDNELILAVGKLRLEHPQLSGELERFILLALRQRQALKFYAEQANYIDDVPHLLSAGDAPPVPDNGLVARYALGEDRHVH